MKKAILISLLNLICFLASGQAQNTINDLEGNPIPYANIGIPGKNIGTVSNLKGEFSLTIPDSLKGDSLRISAIGFKPKIIPLNDGVFPSKITLQKLVYDIEEVQVNSGKLKEKIKGYKTKSRVVQGGFTTNKLGNEVGVLIKVKNRETFLKSFNTHISYNKYDTVRFRLNIYTVKDGLPHENILKENIIIETTQEYGPVSYDLTPHNLWVYEDVIVTIEWIEDLGEQGLYFSAGLGGKVFARETSQGNWEKVSGIKLGLNVKVAN